jgi:hypothetical protein
VTHPTNHRQLDDDHDHRKRESEPEVGDQKGQGVADSSDGWSLGKGHGNAGANGSG